MKLQVCISKGSLSETLTRAIGFTQVNLISASDFEKLDELHYEVENKLPGLISSQESKRETNDWQTFLPHPIRSPSIP